jgi:uncharacterized RDD family membrane protein YckC
MEYVQIQTSQNVGIDFEVAGLGDRVLAALIDYLLIGSYLMAVVAVNQVIGSTAFFLVAGLLPYLLYFLLCEVFLNGQSIGKKIRNIRVVRLDGSQPTLGNYVLRWLLRPLDLEITSGLAAFLCVLIGGKGQRLGDLAAGTTVVILKPRVRLNDTLLARLEEGYVPVFPAAEALTDADVATAREVLRTLVIEGRTHTSFHLGLKMKETLERKMNVSSDLTPVDFLRTVVKDFNALKGKI